MQRITVEMQKNRQKVDKHNKKGENECNPLNKLLLFCPCSKNHLEIDAFSTYFVH